MKLTNIFRTCVVVLAMAGAAMSHAQMLHSGYFLESMVQRHEMNAAFGGEANYIMLPGLGGLQMGVHTNFGLSNYLFERNGELVTGLSSQVSAADFIGQLPEMQRVGVELELPLLSVGFRGMGGFNTIVIKERNDINLAIPSSLLAFIKMGNNTSNGAVYNIDNLGLQVNAIGEVALGHSRKLAALEGFSYGAKAKVLVGLARVSMQIDHIGLSLTTDSWQATTSGTAQMSKGLNLTYENGQVSGFQIDNYAISGWGLGLDLGVAYTPAVLPALTVSLGVNDIGFMKWNDMSNAVAGGTFEYNGFDNIASDDASIEEQLDVILEDVKELINMQEAPATSPTYRLNTTLNVGAEYAILNRKISFGLLSSTRFAGQYTYAEGMAVVNFRPLSWLHVALNGSYSTYGGAVGALLNICPNGFNLFVGCDCFSPSVRFNNQYLPVNPVNANLRVGIAIPFGKRW